MSRVASEATDRPSLSHASEASDRPYREQDVDEPQDPVRNAGQNGNPALGLSPCYIVHLPLFPPEL